MDIYSNKKRWKFLIYVGAFIISIVSVLYTNNIVEKLKYEEKKKMELYAFALQKIGEIEDLDTDMSLITEILTGNTTVPMILTTSEDSIITHTNFNFNQNDLERKIYEQLNQIKNIREPIIVKLSNHQIQKIYYKDSNILSMLFWYPFVQILVFGLFIIISYLAFSSSRKAEQNRVWIGLSRETAHQLGTPISSLMAWVEILKNYPELDLYTPEIEKDINRLNVITQRFSKIGSKPELKLEPLILIIENSIKYMQYRTSDKININFNSTINPESKSLLNKSLFEWVIENLIRNAVDAMHGVGDIYINISGHSQKAFIDVTDSGKGIPKRIQNTIFNPGYTTKQRGWGLGLSLSRRIIENYHNGKIFVKSSENNKGTTFRIILELKEYIP